MTIYNITGDDTFTLYNRVFNDFADDDVSKIAFGQDRAKMKTGKNANTIFAKDATGLNADLTLRLMRGSSDDNFLQGKITDSENDFVNTEIAFGSFVKQLGDGQGGVKNDSYLLNGGMIMRTPDAGENVSGDTNQAVSVYVMKFANCKRKNG